MRRRDFLRFLLGTPLFAGGFGNPAFAALPQRTLVNIMCVGGADFRFLFAPAPTDTAYADKFWAARQGLYNTGGVNYSDYAQAFADLYLPVSEGSTVAFGIHKAAAWLHGQFTAGNVSIVANVQTSGARRHDLAQMVVNTGDVHADQYNYDRDGWGGRLVEMLADANVAVLSDNVPVFAKGSLATNRGARLVHLRDSRNFALSQGDAGVWQTRIARSLKNYYVAKRVQSAMQPAQWPYHKILHHEAKLRQFGEAVKAQTDANPLPASLTDLQLNSVAFTRQCVNLYDSFSAAQLLQQRAIAMDYGGWDTHRAQKQVLDRNFADLFGTGGGLDILHQELSPDVISNTVFVFTTDFGRQLHANGDAGTDHGTGNYLLLVGLPLRGGVYGSMFPRHEIAPVEGPVPYDTHGSDIQGLTSFERVLALACDWVQPGTGVSVFPRTAHNDLSLFPDGPPLEAGVDLSTLFV